MVDFPLEDQMAFAGEKWKPIPRISRTIPFGYKVSEDDPDILIPVEIELEALEKAKKHLKRYSYREVAQWLSAVTGRSISYEGLKKRIAVEQHRRRKAAAIKRWAVRLENAKKTAEKLEAKVGAKYGQDDPSSDDN
jgi:hypothetical protein